ncbi:MAG: DEAD/DEAH box helicase [Verrucomicrobia bacterium]|nr:DEAD/DEAH box helicase [Verrucomicrobiota bacterium]
MSSESGGERFIVVQREPPAQNLNSYRITAADALGEGGPKQKFWQNLTAIQTLRTLEAEGRPATTTEKGILVQYVGWGSLPQVFDDSNEDWARERDVLRKTLSREEWDFARSTTLNAHYTSPVIVSALYAALERFGFEGGRVLEPACGIGHFIGLMPPAMLQRSMITGIEIDLLTARIAQALYPEADIRAQPFEKAKLAAGFYDVAISNVPFGDYPVHDPRWNDYKFPIHDYFFAASVEKVRPGGLILFITSKGTLDKLDSTLREHLSTQAELLGAIRLPNDAFKKNAGTEVTTDFVMLRRLHPGEAPAGPSWKVTVGYTNEAGENFRLNEYFAQRPELMLGRMRLAGRMYRDREPTLESDGRDLAEALQSAISQLPSGVYRSRDQRIAEPTFDQTVPAPDDVKPNAYCLDNGLVCFRDEDVLRPLNDLPLETRTRIRGLIQVRDAVRTCLRTQLDGSPEDQVLAARHVLNVAYDRFAGRHGPIHARANQRAFDGDPDLPLLLSLEQFDSESGLATKAAVFRERTIHRRHEVLRVADAKEALLVTLNDKGRVDLDHMSGLLRRTTDELVPELKGLIFLNPQSNQWETEDQYLSGNVREKLEIAEAAALTDPRFQENATALKSALPADLGPSEIDVRLGAAWLPASDVEQFTQELLGVSTGVRVGHVAALGTWFLEGDWEVKRATANTTDWGTDRRSALELIEDALNLRTPTVHDYDADQKPTVNAQATEAAREKQQRIKERFAEWIWSEDSRRERLCRQYNDTFNHTRVRTFSGDHLTLPGASQNITLQGHQKAGIWRILQTPNTLLAHVVGAGKTFTMVAAAMELRRLGLCHKPLFAVPNHMLGQFSTELLTLYPGAQILVAGKADFEAANRKKLFSRIATGNWDAVIVTHSGFERIPLAKDTKERFFEEQLHELEMVKRQHAGSGDRRLVKEIEKAKKRLEVRLQGLAAEGKKDNTLTFEELGVDRLFVDEAHYFKNLFYVSKMTRIAGLPQTASERAFDMYLKVRHVQSLNGGGGVVFATGTPIANSMAEMFTMQRYLQPEALKRHNLHHFDSWAATFGEPVTALELSPEGAGYRLNTRFARFINVPELMQMFRQTADVQTADMLHLPRPILENGKPSIRNAPATPELKALVEQLAARAGALKTNRVDPRVDNMLKITSEGRKAALDLRLVLPGARDDLQSKVNLAIENIHSIWKASEPERSTQLVFCDLSTPRDSGFSVYRDMAAKLEKLGVPPSQIGFIQDFETDAAKLGLFRDVRSGKVRILFGSTQKMGSGTNVQERLIALHHLDAPWRPADVEQREGRILRQGNRNPVVQIYRYVTGGSFDAYMWQTLETKAKFIAQVMSGDMTIRRLEDLDSAALTYAEVKAIASGNPLVIEKAQVDAELMRLTRLRSSHSEEQYRIRGERRRAEDDASSCARRLANLGLDLGSREDASGDRFTIEINGQTITNRGIAGELLLRQAEKLKSRSRDEVQVGRFGGFDLILRTGFGDGPEIILRGHNSYPARVTDTALGTIRSLEATLQSLEERGEKLEQESASLLKRAAELEARIGHPFEHEEHYQELRKRQSAIADQLDLTKNQAATQLDAEPGPEQAISMGEQETPAETVKPGRKPAVRV